MKTPSSTRVCVCKCENVQMKATRATIALRFSLSMLKSREKRLLTYPQHSAMLNSLMSAVDLPWERKETAREEREERGKRKETRRKSSSNPSLTAAAPFCSYCSRAEFLLGWTVEETTRIIVKEKQGEDKEIFSFTFRCLAWDNEND